jgi:hypothetical protein
MAEHLPRRALGLALGWAELHQNELRANWTFAQQRWPINNIAGSNDPMNSLRGSRRRGHSKGY